MTTSKQMNFHVKATNKKLLIISDFTKPAIFKLHIWKKNYSKIRIKSILLKKKKLEIHHKLHQDIWLIINIDKMIPLIYGSLHLSVSFVKCIANKMDIALEKK